jgi:hypothetical protein
MKRKKTNRELYNNFRFARKSIISGICCKIFLHFSQPLLLLPTSSSSSLGILKLRLFFFSSVSEDKVLKGREVVGGWMGGEMRNEINGWW